MEFLRIKLACAIIAPMIFFLNNVSTGAYPLDPLTGFDVFDSVAVRDVNGQSRVLNRFSYTSGDLTVRCEMILPNEFNEDGFPTLVLCHGGIDGIYGRMRVKAVELADQGYAVFMPTYRGEDGSDGEIEVAKGEVDDVLACVELLRMNEIVNPDKIAVIGSSHGALIAAFCGARDQSIPAIVCAYGVMDIHSWWQYLIDTGQYDWNDELSRSIYGDGPEDKPDEFRIRSGVIAACDIEPPVMLVQGDQDRLVPVSQAETMVSAFENCGKGNYVYNEYAGVGHGFIWFSRIDEGRKSTEQVNTSYQSWEDMLQFIETSWSD